MMAANSQAGLKRHLGSMRGAGFTLLEVMVALMIIGLALPALMARMGTMANTVSYSRDLTIAHWVAENKVQEMYLAETLQNLVPKGRQAGDEEMAGIVWDWRIEAEEQKGMYAGTLRVWIRVGPQGQDPIVELSAIMVEK
ncbi:MAG TPA: type II secretion system minor pseudopilin GspI [Marinagarivorans sp.]